MFLQGLLTTLALPPLLLVFAVVAGGLLAWRGWRAGGLMTALAGLGLLALSMPLVSGQLLDSLERGLPAGPVEAERAGAIVILGAETIRDRDGRLHPGPLTLERLRAGAALHRRTGLPVLVSGGLLRPGDASIAEVMALSLAQDFGVPVRWLETRARDTRDNAALSSAILRRSGVRSALVVTHGWHMPRALEAFARQGIDARPAPLPLRAPARAGSLEAWIPRADHLGASWYALREWVGRAVYALRDGEAVPPPAVP